MHNHLLKPARTRLEEFCTVKDKQYSIIIIIIIIIDNDNINWWPSQKSEWQKISALQDVFKYLNRFQ